MRSIDVEARGLLVESRENRVRRDRYSVGALTLDGTRAIPLTAIFCTVRDIGCCQIASIVR